VWDRNGADEIIEMVNMDEATLWRTLIETKCVRSIRGLHVSDDKIGERFGLHDVAVPHGWHEFLFVCNHIAFGR